MAGLVADAAGGRIVLRSAGFAFRTDAVYPGSPRLGSADPGLYSAAPLGLVWLGVKWKKMRIKLLELRAKNYLSAVLPQSECVAELVADAAGGRFVWRNSGFASRSCADYPGEHSLKLGTPGLYSAAPLGLVCGGAKWRKIASAGQGNVMLNEGGAERFQSVRNVASTECHP